MKTVIDNFKQLLVIILFASGFNTAAQYLVSVSQGTYTSLTGATALSYSSVDDGFYYSTGFKFPVFNRTADFNINMSPPSLGGFLSPTGYLAIYESPGYQNTIVFQCFEDTAFKRV